VILFDSSCSVVLEKHTLLMSVEHNFPLHAFLSGRMAFLISGGHKYYVLVSLELRLLILNVMSWSPSERNGTGSAKKPIVYE
jgi:hypothetical protein